MRTSLLPSTARVRMRFDSDDTELADARPASRVASMPFDATRPRVLHVGSGPAGPTKLHRIFQGPAWREVRLDIDPTVDPDLVASIVDLRQVEASSCDAIWCSHNLEHLCAHEVTLALAEFRRVLTPTGFVLIRSPDLRAVAELILNHGLDYEAYRSPAGPITAADMLYGHAASIARGNAFMRHGTGFTQESLSRLLATAGFTTVLTARTQDFTVWGAAFMPEADIARVSRALRRTGLKLAPLGDDGVPR